MVSGLRPATEAPYSDSVSLRLPYAVKLATERKSLTHYTKGTQSPRTNDSRHLRINGFRRSLRKLSFGSRWRARRKPFMRGSYCLYACGFRVYFTPLPGFFSPFLHSTSSLSVDYEYLALEDGPPMFRQDYTCPALLVVRLVPPIGFRVRGYHPLWPDFPDRSTN